MNLRLAITLFLPTFNGFSTFPLSSTWHRRKYSQLNSSSAETALERTASQLKRLELQSPRDTENRNDDDHPDLENLTLTYLRQAANELKRELKKRNLPTRGRKPDLARRLAVYDIQQKTGRSNFSGSENGVVATWDPTTENGDDKLEPLASFCGMELSKAAATALGKANFKTPSPIQRAVIPRYASGESMIIHAETGIFYFVILSELIAYFFSASLFDFSKRIWKNSCIFVTHHRTVMAGTQ
jgi:hypothetical protein